ncbi:MAG: hypothetical protein K0R59_125 [Sphingobacterium sp.]|jgi:hypothetical protein|nr:hypothetical protein [Sphingobacterium sp.]
MKNKNLFCILGAFILMAASCGKMEDSYQEFMKDGERIYAGRVTEVYTKAGNEKIGISWKIPPDPNINEFRLFWNNGQDSLSIPFERAKYTQPTMELEINPLKSGTYYFNIYTYDLNGRSSVRTDFTGVSYPLGYEIED